MPSSVKTEVDIGEWGSQLPGKAQETRVRWLCRFKSQPSPVIKVSGYKVIHLFLVQRGNHPKEVKCLGLATHHDLSAQLGIDDKSTLCGYLPQNPLFVHKCILNPTAILWWYFLKSQNACCQVQSMGVGVDSHHHSQSPTWGLCAQPSFNFRLCWIKGAGLERGVGWDAFYQRHSRSLLLNPSLWLPPGRTGFLLPKDQQEEKKSYNTGRDNGT